MHKGVWVSQPLLVGVLGRELVVFHGQLWRRLSSDAEAKDAWDPSHVIYMEGANARVTYPGRQAPGPIRFAEQPLW